MVQHFTSMNSTWNLLIAVLYWAFFTTSTTNCRLAISPNALDGNALHSRIDPSDLDMVKIEAKLPLYCQDSCLDSSCSKEDDLEALTFVFGY